MKKNPQVAFEWRTLDDNAGVNETDFPVPDQPHVRAWASPRLICVLILLFLMAGGWRTLRVSEAGIQQIEQELEAAVVSDLWMTDRDLAPPDQPLPDDHTLPVAGVPRDDQMEQEQGWHDQMLQDKAWLPVQLQATDGAAPDQSRLQTKVQFIAMQGDVAALKVITQLDGQGTAVRQVRFYRRYADGWRHTAPPADLWGEPRRKETNYFIFHYRHRDEQAVDAVAAQIDDIYAELLENFGVTSAGSHAIGLVFRADGHGTSAPVFRADGHKAKITIDVSVTTRPGLAPFWFNPSEPLRLASPAVYQAPLELSEADLLRQSIVLPVIAHVWTEAMKLHDVWLRWQQLLYGLRLWQLWDLDIPLAVYRPMVIAWQYQSVDNHATHERVRTDAVADLEPNALPNRYVEFCAIHRLWMLSPDLWQIPLPCTDDGETSARSGHLGLSHHAPPSPRYQPLHLQQTTPWHDGNRMQPLTTTARLAYEAAALATLVEYALQTYDHVQLQDLLAGLAQHDTWSALIPAVYGVSADEFEAGWHTFLQAEYGLALDAQ